MPLPFLLPLALTLQLKVRPLVALVPTDIHIEARIPPAPENRAFCVAAFLDGAAVRRSCEPLDGDESPYLHTIWWFGIREPGDWIIVLTVEHADKSVRSVRQPITLR